MKQTTNPAQAILLPEKSAYQTDKQLWNALRAGCCQAFEQIYQQHFFALYAYGQKITSDREQIKDAIQELFVHIWKKQSSLSETDSIRFYLLKSLKRRLMDMQMKAGKITSLDNLQAIPGLEGPEEENMIQKEVTAQKHRQVAAAVGALSKRQHQAVMYKYYHDLPYPEIAARMAISLPAVYNIISKALTKLGSLMQERDR